MGKDYKKMEKVQSDFTDYTESFTKLNDTKIIDTEGETGTQLVASNNMFIFCVISK